MFFHLDEDHSIMIMEQTSMPVERRDPAAHPATRLDRNNPGGAQAACRAARFSAVSSYLRGWQ